MCVAPQRREGTPGRRRTPGAKDGGARRENSAGALLAGLEAWESWEAMPADKSQRPGESMNNLSGRGPSLEGFGG